MRLSKEKARGISLRGGFVLVVVLGGSSACGASIHAVYEGDVRFEHCMALDADPNVKTNIRRACWSEWVDFYTFGQTRDRVEFAYHRISQIDGRASDQGSELSPLTVPEPTSALAPPPMILSAEAAKSAEPPAEPPAEQCSRECEEALGYCEEDCRDEACRQQCDGMHSRCIKRCG